MFKIICVTNRKMCGDFLRRTETIYKNGVEIILREKDLPEKEYSGLAQRVAEICPDVTLHTYTDTAKRLGINKIHLPFHMLDEKGRGFQTVGVSVHSAGEAILAEQMGADYVIAGHIFETDCKKGLKPHGIEFLRGVVGAVHIPVYAIGGITNENIPAVKKAGAQGACIMSGFMLCENVGKYVEKIRKSY